MFFTKRTKHSLDKLTLTPRNISEKIYFEMAVDGCKKTGKSPQDAALSVFMHILENYNMDGTIEKFISSLPSDKGQLTEWVDAGKIDRESVELAIKQIDEVVSSHSAK